MIDRQPPSAAEVPSLNLQQLKVIAALGRGAKGVVFLVQTEFGELFALKTILKASVENNKKVKDGETTVDGSEYKRISFEQEVLTRFRHPLFPKLRGVLSTDKIVGYAIDYCPGRDLNSLRKKQTEKMFSDDIIRFYAAELVLALEYLHGLGIVYRDLKPENVMIQANGHLMLVDFDLSTKLTVKTPEPRLIVKSTLTSEPKPKKKLSCAVFGRSCNSGISPEDFAESDELDEEPANSEWDTVTKSNSFVGTEDYVAPEIVQGKGHDFAVDWWCLGIMLYEMLYGETPFRGTNRKETFYRILSKSPDLVGEPTSLRDLIGKLLEKDPKQRISVEKIKGHDFFSGIEWDLILQVARPPFIPVGPEGEDMEGNNKIDVESFVQGVFKVEDFESVENKKDVEIDNGVRVEGLNHPTNQTNNFSVF